jgi:hypothetical protein
MEQTLKLKSETQKPSLLCKASKEFSRGMFKLGTNFIQFLLSEHSGVLIQFICPLMTLNV